MPSPGQIQKILDPLFPGLMGVQLTEANYLAVFDSATRQWAKRGAVALGALGLASWAWRQKSSSGSQTTSNRRKKE